jgi:hypothetical protein
MNQANLLAVVGYFAQKSVLRSRIAVMIAICSAAAGSVQEARADFIDAFAHANWTWTPNSDDASIGTTLTTATIFGSDDGTGPDDSTYTIAAPVKGLLSFDWSYSTVDVDDWDSAGFYRNGVFTQLAQNDSLITSGTYSTSIDAGDIFGFYVHSADSSFGPGQMDISNFTFTAVPEPSSITFITILSLAGAAGLIRRRKAAMRSH